MSTLAQLEQELAERQDDLNTCNEMLALDPDSTDALETIPVLEADIADIQSRIADLKAQKSAPPPPSGDDEDVPPPPPKYDMSKHPKFRKASPDAPPPPPPAEEVQAVFNVKDVVMAKYSADKQWYQATIVSKTGSSADPVYKVLFKGYDDQETKRKHEVRAIVEPSKKRKADGTPASATPQPAAPAPKPQKTQQNGPVISAAPAVNTAVLPPKREPSKVSDGPTRLAPEPKKLKGSRVLEKGKSNWQDFQKQGPKKSAGGFGQAKKDSMFRTADLPNAKGELINLFHISCAPLTRFVEVGFTGSGKGMQKDQARTTWKFSGPSEDPNV